MSWHIRQEIVNKSHSSFFFDSILLHSTKKNPKCSAANSIFLSEKKIYNSKRLVSPISLSLYIYISSLGTVRASPYLHLIDSRFVEKSFRFISFRVKLRAFDVLIGDSLFRLISLVRGIVSNSIAEVLCLDLLVSFRV